MPRTLLTLSVLAIASLVLPTTVQADRDIRYIALSNSGTYVISDVWLKWKTPGGEHKSNQFTKDIAQNEGFCLDINKFGKVEAGSEVWIEAQIALGEKQSCRKDGNRHYYQTGSTQWKDDGYYGPRWYLGMGGETLTSNRCENINPDKSVLNYPAGNSDAC